ncbi:unnamed protein product [Ambrosiozyma monospora]|uniref:Unnamed protein product n=1 Tax=Ambrosiozyma monospora TaxID=43982 RepID=A0ACB5TDC3_AMBMO|nr:unnamed protein product [Ambrosiozyma monospora]
MGYDISNYEAVYPRYGTMDDMDKLISEVHKRDMKIICDLVINHTSQEHAWFKESRSSRDNDKADWYIWRDAKIDAEGNRQPPTNWRSYFSGSAWQWDETRQQYYLRLFAEGQPDLNWENEQCREAIYQSAVKFWLDKGVDGFRIDTAGLYSKTYPLKNAPEDPKTPIDGFAYPRDGFVSNGPRIHEFHKELHEVMAPYDTMTVGEVGGSSREDTLKYVSAKEKEMDMIFLFNLVDLGSTKGDKFNYRDYTSKDFKDAVFDQSNFIKGTDAWSTAFIENHDQSRCISRFGDDSTPKLRNISGKMLATLQATLSGTLFVYEGQEIGMTNVPLSWDISEYKDVNTINYWNAFLKTNPTEQEKDKLKKIINKVCRDNGRTPMLWDDSKNGGFTTGEPWMRANDNYKEVNAAKERADPNSIYNYYKKALQIRKEYRDVLVHG